MGCALVVMARFPEAGSVKTRLARSVGDERACALYRAFLADIDAEHGAAEPPLHWAMTPPGTTLDSVLGEGRRYLDQCRGGLGARMLGVFSELLPRYPDGVAMLGGDVPLIDRGSVAQALDALRGADAVVRPTADGGYGMLALRHPHDLFAGVDMGTPRVLAQTVERCRLLGLRLGQLEETFDVDELSDVRRLQAAIAGGARLPATARVLAEWQRAGVL